jgi:hypothetical protein
VTTKTTDADSVCSPSPTPVASFGAVAGDGTVLEPVQPPAGLGLQLLLRQAEGYALVEQFSAGAVTYVPPPWSGEWRRACPFPLCPEPLPPLDGEAASELFPELVRPFTRLVEGGEAAELAAAFVLSTWFSDVLPQAAMLLLIDQGVPRLEPLASLLHSLCRHPLALGEFNHAIWARLPSGLAPTLFVDAADVERGSLPLLLRSARGDAFVLSGGQPRQLSAAKVITCSAPLDLAAITPGAVSVFPQAEPLSAGLLEEIAAAARTLRGRLLAYRMENLARVGGQQLLAPAGSRPARQLCRALALPLVGAPELQARLLERLQPSAEERWREWAGRPEGAVLEAVLAAGHAGKPQVYVGQLRCDANLILEGRGEPGRLGERQVGALLKFLGLHTERLDRHGRGLRLSNLVQQRAHHLARASPCPPAFAECSYCPPGPGATPPQPRLVAAKPRRADRTPAPPDKPREEIHGE